MAAGLLEELEEGRGRLSSTGSTAGRELASHVRRDLIYLLDTNTCVYVIKREAKVLRRLEEHSPNDFGISAITVAELWFGAAKSSRPRQTRASVDAFLTPFEILAFGTEAAERYAESRLQLEKIGQPIGERDLLIAATAKSRRLTVVTHNVREFSRVSGLKVEDWR
jgi:tRNA(fMet)-specific endonuclease VapC